MKIIGHRGAAGEALENTSASITAALRAGVDAIEIDIRRTKDNRLVLCHDDNLFSIAGQNTKIKNLTLKQIRAIKLIDDSHVITLEQALQLVGNTTVIIELKEAGCVRPLVRLLKDFPTSKVFVTSFLINELVLIRDLSPHIKILVLEHTRPFDIIHLARIFKFDGLGLNFWLLNPITYWQARRHNLIIYVYTVNHRFNLWFIRLLYPKVAICTDYPKMLTLKIPKHSNQKRKPKRI